MHHDSLGRRLAPRAVSLAVLLLGFAAAPPVLVSQSTPEPHLTPMQITGRTVPRLLNPARAWNGRGEAGRTASLDPQDRFRTVREAFWRCYPSCPEFARLEEDYASVLLVKDYYLAAKFFMASQAQTAFGDLGRAVIPELMFLNLDGGIPPACSALFGNWNVERLVKETEAKNPGYLEYEACRNRFEFYMGAASPLRSTDSRTHLMGVIGMANLARAQSPKDVQRHYDTLIAALGEPQVQAVMARALKERPSYGYYFQNNTTTDRRSPPLGFENRFTFYVGRNPEVRLRTIALSVSTAAT